ncbi:hypothetical protein P692DRAFT_20830596 [Suillus brevipes Sb2]|nr:hypothetical protein P692DRAFT_20830596 [Suillus brevipes Sb2]
MAFTYSHPYPMPAMSVSQHVQAVPQAAGAPQAWTMPTFAVPGPCLPQPENNTVPEPAEDASRIPLFPQKSDFWENDEIRDADEL